MSIRKRYISEGHLIDSNILANIFNTIIAEGADYEIIKFKIGKTNLIPSTLEIDVISQSNEMAKKLENELVQIGCYELKTPDAEFRAAEKDNCAPDEFYSTTNHKTRIYYDGDWHTVSAQRMDAVVVKGPEGPFCKKLRDVRKGDLILCSPESVRVFPPEREREREAFEFMGSVVSSERSVRIAVCKIADDLRKIKNKGGRIVVVAGPVIIHTGAAAAMGELIGNGYVHGLLSGNALAVHDVEAAFYNTSLGVDLRTGKPAREGAKNHMRAINRIYRHGSIAAAIEAGDLTKGIMYETIRKGIPFCLAGSIRDDGPLPETVTDMIEAQEQYARICGGAEMVIMLSTMLHAIGTANMIPSWVKTICVDINPAVVAKLSDRGSGQTIGIVSDVGLFVQELAARIKCRE